MPRPYKKERCDWFPHDADMRNHRKVKALRLAFGGPLGYAFWAMMLEYLTDADRQRMEYTPEEVLMFSDELGASADEVNRMIQFCIERGMLRVFTEVESVRTFLISESLMDRFKSVYEKRAKMRDYYTHKTPPAPQNGVSDGRNPDPAGKVPNLATNSIVKESIVENINIPAASDEPAAPVIKEKPKAEKKISGLHNTCIKAFTDWYEGPEVVGIKYKFQAGPDAKAMQEILKYLKTAVEERNGAPARDDQVLLAWTGILKSFPKWDAFYKTNLKLSQINSNLPNIMANVKGITRNGNGPISKRQERERIAQHWGEDYLSQSGAQN